MTKATVLRVDQSPMNPLRWCLALSCGHEEWITRKTRPNTYEPRTGAPRLIVCTTCHPSHRPTNN